MCDNKPSRFEPASTMISSFPSSFSSTSKPKISASSSTTLIDKFYDNRKNLFDICGNFINKEKYPFINILSTYLVDIVNSIDIEINKSTRNSMINWREKKNPKLLSKFINSDDNINIINRSMNKITASNYMTIVSEITGTLMQDNFRKIPEYSKFLFDTIIKKCLNDEKFATDYLHFLVAFDGVIGKNINQYVNDFISEVFSLLNNNTNNLKCNDNDSYFSYIKDVNQYMNIGIILANLYLIKNESNTSPNIKMYLIFAEYVFCEKIVSCLNHINNYLEWLPSDMNEVNGRIYLLFGIIEIIGKKLLEIISVDNVNFLNDILTLIYNVNTIPNKIKFKVLDIQDMIKTYNKSKQTIENTNTITKPITKPIIKSVVNINIEPIELPITSVTPVTNVIDIVETIPKKNKPLNYSSLKLVQMQSNKNPIDLAIPKVEIPKVEVPKVEIPKVEVPKVDATKVEVPRVDATKVEVPRIEVSKVEIPLKNDRNKKDNQDKDVINRNSNNSNSNNNSNNNNRNRNRNNNKRNNDRNNDRNNESTNKNNISNFTSTITSNSDDDGFIKIERKPRINNDSNTKNNLRFKK